MTLKQQLKIVSLVTSLQKKENSGTDAEVEEFGWKRSVAGWIQLLVTCVTFA